MGGEGLSVNVGLMLPLPWVIEYALLLVCDDRTNQERECL
jgi:hypothetical protein